MASVGNLRARIIGGGIVTDLKNNQTKNNYRYSSSACDRFVYAFHRTC